MTTYHSCFQLTIFSFFKPVILCQISAHLWGWVNNKRTAKLSKLWGVKLTRMWNLKWQLRLLTSRAVLKPRKKAENAGKDAYPSKFRGTHSTGKHLATFSKTCLTQRFCRQHQAEDEWTELESGQEWMSLLSLPSPILCWIITGKWVKAG